MTMKTPEMEVVRFSESDVIVASPVGPQSYALTKFANGTPGDGELNGKNLSTVQDILAGMGEHTYFQYQNNPKVRATDLQSNEESGLLHDGIYVDQGEKITGTDITRLWLCQ